MEPPIFSAYLHPTEDSMSKEQKAYLDWLSSKCNAGRFPDVQQSVDYLYFHVFRRLRELEASGRVASMELHEHLVTLSRAYDLYTTKHPSKTVRKDYIRFVEDCERWAGDCLIFAEAFEEFLDYTTSTTPFWQKGARSNDRLNVSYRLDLPALPIDLLQLSDLPITKFTKEHSEEYLRIVSEIVEREAQENGSWFDRLLEAGIEQEKEYEKEQIIRETKAQTLDEYQKRKSKHLQDLKEEGFTVLDGDIPSVVVFRSGGYGNYLFAGETSFSALWPKPYYCFYVGINRLLRPLSREAENELRRRHSVPEVGQGWISETALFNALRDTFSETQVVQHGSPDWLGRQHLDIWFPSWGLGVEYHGAQHFQPVEFFGGEDAFEATKKRDQKKVQLCRKHGLKLFVVTEESSPDDLIERIRKHAKNQSEETYE